MRAYAGVHISGAALSYSVFGRSDLRWKESEGKKIRWKERVFSCLVEMKKGEGDLKQCISVHGTHINSVNKKFLKLKNKRFFKPTKKKKKDEIFYFIINKCYLIFKIG